MKQKYLYIGQFNGAGRLIAAAKVQTFPHKNNRLIPPNARRITKAEYDRANLTLQPLKGK